MKQNVLNTSIGLPTLLIEELKTVFKQKHPTQFIFDIAAKMKKDYKKRLSNETNKRSIV